MLQRRVAGPWLMLAAAVLAASCNRQPSPVAPTTITAGLSCGEERWAVKTLSDPDATRVNLAAVVATTVSAMNALPPHCNNLPDSRSFAEEFRLYELTGRVTLVRAEEDRDFHIVLADPAAPDQTMIVESVDPDCEGAVSSPHVGLLRNARAMFTTLHGGRPSSLVGQTVRVRGVGFFDLDHGQTGRSKSCVELHPILAIER